ncbi:heterodimeric geranylgeranyl pyrophosphate synthase small subunit, chloroplastic-like [Vicia villosa]|uniref:heterodimeric geranylgeranyl pyrophosphate synthase small subunit, chloroplastic-like n=1 Tax=Vicia villosa TaxID=3911 RepID=UPI00273BC12A|nr:heterodimeric geranylgeranyl pyrophosphate synthase small subunit, chloroplastic-like [Vicia villosa]
MATITSHLTNVKSTVHFSPISSNQHRSDARLKPATVRMTMTQQTRNPHLHWASLHADIEAHLKSTITLKEPLEVFEPMHHLIFSAPKTTVPALCLAACELVGGQRHQAISAASALLLMEAATYVHQHLPLTDKPKPEPEPGMDHVYGPNVELLTGDGIVPFGFELLARSDDGENSERILRVMIEISRAVGSRGVIEAQYRKTMDRRSDGEEICHVEEMRRVVEKYECGMHSCGAVCGGVLGGGSDEEIEKLRKVGFYVGMIQRMAQRGFNDGKELNEARNLALQELKFFKDKEIDAFKMLLNSTPSGHYYKQKKDLILGHYYKQKLIITKSFNAATSSERVRLESTLWCGTVTQAGKGILPSTSVECILAAHEGSYYNSDVTSGCYA